ncbi:MAG: hypothetical protein AABY54_04615 [Deltaproteobacteria bacterium]
MHLEATPEEMELMKKHQWNSMPLCEGTFKGNVNIKWTVGMVVGKPQKWGFTKVEHLAYVESEVIENAKKLKSQLEAVAGFTSGGPREIEL